MYIDTNISPGLYVYTNVHDVTYTIGIPFNSNLWAIKQKKTSE